MQIFFQRGPGSFWQGPAVLGALLIAIGVILIIVPELLAYVVAAAFIFGGLGLIASGWSLRRNVTYQRIDAMWEDQGPGA